MRHFFATFALTMKHYIHITLLFLGCLIALPVMAQDDARDEEREAYNAARLNGSVEAWDIFMNNYPDSYYMEQARKYRDDAVVKAYCNEGITLDRLVAYIDNSEAHEPRIKTFYANLVNNITHCYRAEHLGLGFAGCTGKVTEVVTLAGGKVHRNTFVFNAQGLLTETAIVGGNGKLTTTTYTYAYDNLHGYSLKQRKTGGKTVRYAPFYDDNDRLTMMSSDNKERITYQYSDNGILTKMVVATGNVTRTRQYNGGYVTREDRSDGTATRFLYDFDTATGRKFLIGTKELKVNEVTAERKMTYKVDTHGRVTRVVVTQADKTLMTIERTYE